MPAATHSLYVTGPAGAVFRVTDGASRCVATGMCRLELQLPAGIYSVGATLGRSVEAREVLLDRAQTVAFQNSLPSFGDRAYALAPDVIAALGDMDWRADGQLIVLRGPYRDAAAAEAAEPITLQRGDAAIEWQHSGLLPDPASTACWQWQCFDLARTQVTAAADAHTLVLTRSIVAAPGPESKPLRQRVSHVLPDWPGYTVWAAYPAEADAAPQGAELPLQYYLRLRLSLPGAAPAMRLQSLSDQVFTSLAARSPLPLSKPVLDLMLLSDEADPLLALAAAHVAAIVLALEGQLQRLPQDPPPTDAAPAGDADDPNAGPDAIHALKQRFAAWLQRMSGTPIGDGPDGVALRHLYGLAPQAHLHSSPLLLRSLDALMAATRGDARHDSAIDCDESVLGQRFQLSEAFAFVQWQPDLDYQSQLADLVTQSLRGARAQQQWSELIRAAEPEPTANAPGAAMRSFDLLQPAADTTGNSADLERLLRANAVQLRIPDSQLSQLRTMLQIADSGANFSVGDGQMQPLNVGLGRLP